jgi:hypothetical protein
MTLFVLLFTLSVQPLFLTINRQPREHMPRPVSVVRNVSGSYR